MSEFYIYHGLQSINVRPFISASSSLACGVLVKSSLMTGPLQSHHAPFASQFWVVRGFSGAFLPVAAPSLP
ncbi:hypothetical protein BDR07DRAFT_1428998 [Suillus spraguei]|nr:hypothetical protein BDR07DRAFT_1428998 [Suillus spraguei]